MVPRGGIRRTVPGRARFPSILEYSASYAEMNARDSLRRRWFGEREAAVAIVFAIETVRGWGVLNVAELECMV